MRYICSPSSANLVVLDMIRIEIYKQKQILATGAGSSKALGKLKYSTQTFQLFAYEVQHVYPQIFSWLLELSFFNVLKRSL